ncbi:Phenylalanyl-tRNA synthetase alpha chain [Lactiplantibacillus plantarum subsp. plantarum]|nr:Phenylalanyl-tRNA synthetase alpha chain [Lactiplantibacillus plantarum subsp. plantarum]
MSLQDRLTELRDQGLADIKSADVLKRLTKSKLIYLAKGSDYRSIARNARLKPGRTAKGGRLCQRSS